jgi:uncharacterized protein (TIGR02145 family)
MILTHGMNSIQRTLYETILGTSYKCVKIGNLVWMAENLHYSGSEIASFLKKDSNTGTYYYKGKNLGTNLSSVLIPDNGYRIPTSTDFHALFDACGIIDVTDTSYEPSSVLKSTTGWDEMNGTDDFGFNLTPNGYWNNSVDEVLELGKTGHCLGQDYYIRASYDSNEVMIEHVRYDPNPLTLRLCRDA